MIKRYILEKIEKHLPKKEISLIVGPRQAGKTTLMKFLKENLEKQGKNTLYLSLDIDEDSVFFENQSKLIKKIELEFGKNKGFVFIDEIQRKENAGLFLKGLYDRDLPYKFIVSGSGSVELKEGTYESLAGRKRIFELSTVSFEEFVNFKTDYKYEDKLSDFLQLESQKTENLFLEYLNFGGYPRVILEETAEEKTAIIRDIYQSYLEKDISLLLGIEKIEHFTNLVRALSSQIGSLVNFSELASTLGLSVATVQHYLWYLEKTYILKRVNPYFKNTRKEITKSPVYYFTDLGMRNYAFGSFGSMEKNMDLGFVFENFVFNNLRQKFASKLTGINFWRSKEKAEVDFILNFGQRILPIEVKYKKIKEPKLSRSLRSFVEKYHPEAAAVINLNLSNTDKIAKTKLYFRQYYNTEFIEKF